MRVHFSKRNHSYGIDVTDYFRKENDILFNASVYSAIVINAQDVRLKKIYILFKRY